MVGWHPCYLAFLELDRPTSWLTVSQYGESQKKKRKRKRNKKNKTNGFVEKKCLSQEGTKEGKGKKGKGKREKGKGKREKGKGKGGKGEGLKEKGERRGERGKLTKNNRESDYFLGFFF